MESTFSGVPIFIRLDPWFVAEVQPLEPLLEAIIRPARPGWWKTLALRNRDRDGGHYILQSPSEISPETMNQHIEFHIDGVRSLEVHAKRNKVGNLSMMVEELTDDRRPDGRLIGRCIHLDTDAAVGTDARFASLNHIDLAINIYFGQAATCRQTKCLSDGMVEDASVRTHLLRAESVPFLSLVEFARQFFRSTVLWDEWIRDQFDGLVDYT